MITETLADVLSQIQKMQQQDLVLIAASARAYRLLIQVALEAHA